MRKSLIVLLWLRSGENLASCLLLPVFAPNRILGVPHGVVGGDVVLSLRLNRGQQFFVRDQTTKISHDHQISSDHPPYTLYCQISSDFWWCISLNPKCTCSKLQNYT